MKIKNNKSGLTSFDPNLQGIDPFSVHQIRLSNGNKMPAAAFGTFHSDWAQQYMHDATLEAIRLGWRHLDTARAYENEDVIGKAIREAIKRKYIASSDELFITGKLWNGHMSPKHVAPALHKTLESLGIDRLDLYLNHWPWPNVHTPGCDGDHRNDDAVPYIHEDFMKTWTEIVKLKETGLVKDIGTSNHTRATMELLLRDVSHDERPVVNQMEMHPLFQQTDLRNYFFSEGISCMGYMAMGSPNRPARDTFKEHQIDMLDPTIVAISNELNIPPSVVCLSWALQRENKSGGYVVMSTTPKYILSNLKCSIKDFLLDKHIIKISGDGSLEESGIDSNNRLILGQVFLWLEAEANWSVLWDDSQVFETREDYLRFKKVWKKYKKEKDQITYRSLTV